MNARLRALADTLFVIHGRKLPVNDLSIEWGGKFDVDATYSNPTDPGHFEHMIGESADVRTSGGGAEALTLEQERFVYAQWRRLEGHIKVHPSTSSNPHYHLRFRSLDKKD